MMPRKIVIVPSVTTIGGMLSFQTSKPLNMPMSAPSPMATTRITGTGTPGAATFSIATTMPVSARFAATDRSMHLVRITTIWPSASRISGEVSLKTLARFDGRDEGRKAGGDQRDQQDDDGAPAGWLRAK